jgi:hypothetical protein
VRGEVESERTANVLVVRARKGDLAIVLLEGCIWVYSEGLCYSVKVEKRGEAGSWNCCHNSGRDYSVYVYRRDDVKILK